jgi:hypothetical protein
VLIAWIAVLDVLQLMFVMNVKKDSTGGLLKVIMTLLVLMFTIMVSYLKIGEWLITFLKEVKLGLIENILSKMNYHNILKVLPFS